MFEAAEGLPFLLTTCAWQTTVLLGVGLVATLVLSRRSSRAHHVLLLAILACFAVPPGTVLVEVLNLGAVPEAPRVVQVPVPVADSDLPAPVPVALPTRSMPGPPRRSLPAERSAVLGTSRTLSSPAVASSSSPRITRARGVTVVTWACMLASLLALVRLAHSVIAGRRLVLMARPLCHDGINRAIQLAAKKHQLRTAPVARVSDRIRGPMIWCWNQTRE